MIDGRIWKRVKRKDHSYGPASPVRRIAVTPARGQAVEPQAERSARFTASPELRAATEADVMAIATAEWFNTPEAVAAEVDRRLAGIEQTRRIIETGRSQHGAEEHGHRPTLLGRRPR
jgi:hypothetical protein